MAISFSCSPKVVNEFPEPAPGKPTALCLLAQCKMLWADAGPKPTTGSSWVRHEFSTASQFFHGRHSQTRLRAEAILPNVRQKHSMYCIFYFVVLMFVVWLLTHKVVLQSWYVWFTLVDFLHKWLALLIFLGAALFVTDHNPFQGTVLQVLKLTDIFLVTGDVETFLTPPNFL